MKKRKVAINTTGGVCKTLYSRYGRLSWENFLGRLENGGWDCQITSIMEIYEDSDEHGTGRDLQDDKGAVL